jgi:hypothetical protein
LYWGYNVTFTKVLTIYHCWIHPLYHSPSDRVLRICLCWSDLWPFYLCIQVARMTGMCHHDRFLTGWDKVSNFSQAGLEYNAHDLLPPK